MDSLYDIICVYIYIVEFFIYVDILYTHVAYTCQIYLIQSLYDNQSLYQSICIIYRLYI